jgi:hypothetical protein
VTGRILRAQKPFHHLIEVALAVVIVIDVKSPEIFGLVFDDAAATAGGIIDCNCTRQPSGSAIARVCGIVGLGR